MEADGEAGSILHSILSLLAFLPWTAPRNHFAAETITGLNFLSAVSQVLQWWHSCTDLLLRQSDENHVL